MYNWAYLHTVPNTNSGVVFAFFASFFISEVVIAQNVNQFDENKQRISFFH